MAPACASKRWIMAGNIPTRCPQAIKLINAEGRCCICVPIMQNGKVVDDDAAKDQAKQLVDGHDVELWQRDRKVALFQHKSKQSSS
jgi:hypothetical protein